MFVASNFALAIARLLELVINAYIWIIIARAIISWVNPDPYNPIVRFLYRVTEPVLRPVRHRLPTLAIGARPVADGRHPGPRTSSTGFSSARCAISRSG